LKTNETIDWSIHDVVDYVTKAADSFIGSRKCSFSIAQNKNPNDANLWVEMHMKTPNMIETRSVPFSVGENTMEILDLLMVKLTHMAVNCGLIETTPKNATHNISITGKDWKETEVQLDGHTLRGLYSVDLKIKAGQEQEIKLGFSRSHIYLDQDFLPRNMKMEIEGMENTLAVLRQLVSWREKGFKNEETGEQFAKLHSSDEEVELYRIAYEVLTLYEAVLDDDEIIEVGSSLRVH